MTSGLALDGAFREVPYAAGAITLTVGVSGRPAASKERVRIQQDPDPTDSVTQPGSESGPTRGDFMRVSAPPESSWWRMTTCFRSWSATGWIRPTGRCTAVETVKGVREGIGSAVRSSA
jgi:hypothetical protein